MIQSVKYKISKFLGTLIFKISTNHIGILKIKGKLKNII